MLSPERDCKRCRKPTDARSGSFDLASRASRPRRESLPSTDPVKSSGNDHVASTAMSLTLVDPMRRFALSELRLPRAEGTVGMGRVSSAERLRGEGGGRMSVFARAAGGRQGSVDDGGGIEFGGGTDDMER